MSGEIALPYRTDWREMSSVLDYCKGKGADRGALEARFGAGENLRETLNALEQLGLIERAESGDARLTMAGEQLAYAPDKERVRARLVEALLGYAPYRFPLERAVADSATLLDGPWVEHIWQVDMRLGQPRNRVEEARTFFFRVADEAGLGVYRRGVRGQTTRLELSADFADTLRPLLEREASPPPSFAPEPEPADAARAPGAPPPATPFRLAGVFPATAADAGGSAAVTPADGVVEGASLSLRVDMSAWELDKIEAFLRLIGYLPRPRWE
ncbi:MAG TPA: hypothetical protein VMM78_08855 [Thermomicrobiales bacterium]|nr:hypothetical protein [Thermomicrobiales bacterium]